jgi:RHH-type proline utilization regulon transcriptional repressor/proline dehydrogenase/delta 1-pyrroline-5-carboxylate dehydrogenase
VQAVLFGGPEEALKALAQHLASLDGPIVPVHVTGAESGFPAEFLLLERSVSTNTAAAGGNAKLMMLG